MWCTFCVQLRGSLGWKPRHLHKNASHWSVCIAIWRWRCPLRPPHHVLSRCVFISNKFPRLLAEREIIANAFYLSGFLPEPRAKLQNLWEFKCFWVKNLRNISKRMENKEMSVTRPLTSHWLPFPILIFGEQINESWPHPRCPHDWSRKKHWITPFVTFCNIRNGYCSGDGTK